MSTRDDVLDLSARARRGDATDEELRRLRAGLSASATLRVAHQVGADFDAALAVKAADSELVDDVIARALAHTARPARRSSKRPGFAVWLAAAAALLCSAGALAWWHAAPTPERPSVAPKAAAAVASGAASADPSWPRLGPVPSAARAAAVATPQRSSARDKPSAPADAEVGAEALFARANQARGAGRATEAIELYRRLQASHPSSAEALTSRIALGRLLLARGEHSAALSELERHLSAGGALTEEALLWKARTLRQMGRIDEEQHALRTLLSRFPSTAYEQEAKRRLGLAPAPAND